MTQFVNNIKTVMLFGALFSLIVFVGAMIGGRQGMIIAFVVAGAMNFFAWFYSDKLAIAAMRGQEIGPDDEPRLYEMTRRLAERAGLPMPRLFICPQDAPNAFATGRNPRHAAVAVTTGLLRLLNDAEIEGVIAHELAHIKNRDTLISMVAATVAGVFSMLAQWAFFFGMGNRAGGNPLAVIAVLILGAIGAAMIKMTISRAREFVADADGAKIAGSPHGLVNALQKLDAMARRVPLRNPNPAMNNMFIVEPFVGKTLTNLFASHPPVEQRVASLLRQR